MRVFISHTSKDNTAVKQLATQLTDRGFTPWFDGWEILPGDDIVAKINQGLDQCDAGIIVFSADSEKSQWVSAETSYLTYARIQEGKILIPIPVDEHAWVPPLLRPLARCAITDIDVIEDALRHRRAPKRSAEIPEHGRVEHVLIHLDKATDGTITTEVRLNGDLVATSTFPEIPNSLARAHRSFLEGVRTGMRRSPAVAERNALESTLTDLGRELRTLCLPADAAPLLQDLVDARKLGITVEVCFESAAPGLLALPFEALRLPNDRVLALEPAAVLLRRPANLTKTPTPPLAGPLKILVAVGAPDEQYSGNAVLDLEIELQNILDAVEPANRQENVQVRILEVGHPQAIADALREDAYHVLHISCHGLPGALELEDEDGRPVRTTAAQLIGPILNTGRPLPMVLLNSCHGGVHDGQAASFAESLLRAGVQCVLAMQTSVTDSYATDLAREFYLNLATKRELLLPSRALADARKRLEADRQTKIQKNSAEGRTQPEYATATLFIACEENKLAEFGADKHPLTHTPQYAAAGPIPQLSLGDLIGRRKELRDLLRTLRNPSREYAGVVLTGMGGIGKSSVAGRAIQRLKESDWLLAVHKGKIDLGAIAKALAKSLDESNLPLPKKLSEHLFQDLSDEIRLHLAQRALAEVKVLLVLDDFEQNLTHGGNSFQNPATAELMRTLAGSAQTGRLLLTSRYPVADLDAFLVCIPVLPLSPAQTRKLLFRLQALSGVDPAILHKLGGHPRMLELFDAILRGGKGRFPHVTEKLRELLKKQAKPLGSSKKEPEAALDLALMVGASDIFLDELLDIVRAEKIEDFLLQTAVSNLPVSAPGLARMLDENGGDPDAASDALHRLHDLSLIYLDSDGEASLHRWTAEGLRRSTDEARWQELANRAAIYRVWRINNESHDLADGVEAVRNFLTGHDFDAAASNAQVIFDDLRRLQQSSALASLASEVLQSLAKAHPKYALIADEEARSHLALGMTDLAISRYHELLVRQEKLVEAEPNLADYQTDLAVFYERMGDLYRNLGQTELARDSFLKALAMREKLTLAEPDRADYQRELCVPYERMGDLYRNLGQTELARDSFLKALAMREKLTLAEPDRADYQRGLSVSYNKIGDLYRDLGQTELARDSFFKSLDIRQKLALAEPDRADYQRDLSISHERIGDLYRDHGQTELARDSFLKSLAIIQKLASAEPDRADYQRDLSVSYNKIGDIYRDLGQNELARDSFLKSLAIIQKLALAEPDRADYQRDLFVSFFKLSQVDPENARTLLSQATAILQQLKDTGRLLPGDEKYLKHLTDLLQT